MNDPTDNLGRFLRRFVVAWKRAPASLTLATVGGVGYLPLAPGTWGSLVAIPLVVFFSGLPFVARIVALAVLLGVAVPASTRAGRVLEEHDSPHIVVDEVVGLWMTLVWFPHLDWISVVIGFVAFRAFDIAKPPGARGFDVARNDGLGVVGDDLVAGLWAAAIVAVARWSLGY